MEKQITNNLMPFSVNYRVTIKSSYQSVQILAANKKQAKKLFLDWYQLGTTDMTSSITVYADNFTLWRYPDDMHKFLCKGLMSEHNMLLYRAEAIN